MEYAVTPEMITAALYVMDSDAFTVPVGQQRTLAVEIYRVMRASEEAENKKTFAEIFGEQ